MREAIIYLRLLFILILFVPSVSFGLPPEGLEAYGILKQAGGGGKFVYAYGGYTHTDFTSDYQRLQAIVSQPLFGQNYLSYGADLTTGDKLGDRDSYFARYDQVFFNQSLSLKLNHIDYRYISSGKNILSLDYNNAFHIGRTAFFYMVIGLYYRASLNSWNQPSWSAFNYNTEDNEFFPEILFGSKVDLTSSAFLTLDLGNREIFNSLNGDNVAFDVSINLKTTKSVTLRAVMANKIAGLLGGNGDIGEQTFLLGFITPL